MKDKEIIDNLVMWGKVVKILCVIGAAILMILGCVFAVQTIKYDGNRAAAGIVVLIYTGSALGSVAFGFFFNLIMNWMSALLRNSSK